MKREERNKEYRKKVCDICGKEIFPCSAEDVVYIKTKRRNEIYMHKECFEKKRENDNKSHFRREI